MKEYTITGGGGLKLHVVEDGNPNGRPLLFIHGWSQSYLAWVNQFDPSLTGTFRVVAMDNRGHGLSDKPRDVYGESKLWADDINSVITELNLDRPIVSAWSYGGMVICDYLRVYGESNLGGVHFVSAISKLGTEAANEVIGDEFFANATRSMSDNTEECIAGIQAYIRQSTFIEMELNEFFSSSVRTRRCHRSCVSSFSPVQSKTTTS
jgi:non-heme chloroperoxidase